MKKLYCFVAFLLPFSSFAQCPAGDVVLTTQDEVNSFPTDHPGCVTLPQNLSIIGQPLTPDITDLSPLAVITGVGGGIYIQTVEGLATLNGLQNITAIGNDLEISENPLLTDITGLSGITDVPGKLLVSGNGALPTLLGLQNVTAVGNDLDIYDNASLTTLSSLTLTSVGDDMYVEDNPLLTDLQGLQNIVNLGDELNITNNEALASIQALSGIAAIKDDISIISNPLLSSLAGIEHFTTYGGDLIISDNASLATLQQLSNVTTIGGELNISEMPLLTNLNGLHNLTSVGTLYIYQNAALTTLSDLALSSANLVIIEDNDLITDLSGLDGITAVSEFLAIADNDALTSLTGLAGLTDIGSLIIANNSALTNIQALSQLTSLTMLQIVTNNALTDLQGLENVTTIDGQLLILDNNGLTSLRGLDGLTTVDGIVPDEPGFILSGNANLTDISNLSAFTRMNSSLLIINNSSLASLSGLDNLESIGPYSTLWIGQNPSLTSLAGIGKFQSVNNVVISENEALTDLSGLETLGSVTDVLSIIGNNGMTSLKGLNNLTTIGGHLVLDSNPALESLSDLNNLTLLQQMLTITDNVSLGTCAVAGICAYLKTSSPDVVTIYGNNTGCDSQEEIETDCASLPVTLVEFKAEKKENAVQIRWSTSSEVNSSYFEIQHSQNSGKSWEIIGRVQASKESFEVKKYEFPHLNPSSGVNLYRLSMVDQDGTFALSTIRNVTFNQANGFSVYPNPVAEQLTVEASNDTPEGNLRVFNAAGKMLFSRDVNFSGKPYHFETSALPDGLYTIQVSNGSGTKEVKKFIKLAR